jgi:hypothetical protein
MTFIIPRPEDDPLKGSKQVALLKYTHINCIFNFVVFYGYSSSYLIHKQRGWLHLKIAWVRLQASVPDIFSLCSNTSQIQPGSQVNEFRKFSSRGYRGRGVRLTAHFNLLPIVRMIGATPPFSLKISRLGV